MNVKLSSALVHQCTGAPVHWCTSAPSVTVLGINIIHIAQYEFDL